MDNQEEQILTMIATVIEFLVECKSQDFLFNEVMAYFSQLNFLKQFIQCLEPFVIESKIRYMPEVALKQLVSYYEEIGKLELMEQIILSLDLTLIESEPFIGYCVEYSLFRPLIYIATIKDKVFLFLEFRHSPDQHPRAVPEAKVTERAEGAERGTAVHLVLAPVSEQEAHNQRGNGRRHA